MKFQSSVLIIAVLLLFCLPVSNAQEENVIINEGMITISANSKNVWKILTNTKKYANMMGYEWKSGKENVEAVGDQAEMNILDLETAYQVTILEPGQKLSIKIVPTTAEYVNEKTWVIIPVSKWKTKVEVKDVYTLPSNIVSENASEQINTLQNRLEKLRSLAERSY